jgi:hypothetical protein
MSSVVRQVVSSVTGTKKSGASAIPTPLRAMEAAIESAQESARSRTASRTGTRRSGGTRLLMSPARSPADNNQDGQTTLGVKGTLKS